MDSVEYLVANQRAKAADQQHLCVEVGLADGAVRWANASALTQLGYTTGLVDRRLLDLVPSTVREEFTVLDRGVCPPHYVLPLLTGEERVAWVLVTDVEAAEAYYWLRGSVLMLTAQDDLAFVHMRVHMEVANRAGDALHTHTQGHAALQSEVHRLSGTNNQLSQQVQSLRQRIAQVATTATHAVNVALENQNALNKLTASLDGLEQRVSNEIMRLIGQDDAYSQRLARFEDQLADRLQGAAQKASDSIRTAASNAGKDMTKVVIKPAALLGAFYVVVEHLLSHPEILGKLVLRFWG